jgi:peptide/nickel transport system substrate-binding protein
MGRGQYSRREFIRTAGILGGSMVVLGACTPGRSVGGGINGHGGAALPPIEGATVVTDPTQFPKKFAESPDFARLVRAGKLPPVAERIGQDPLVMKPLHSIGKYGGEIIRGYVGVSEHQSGRIFCGSDALLDWDYTGTKIVPNIARGYDLSKNGKVMTLHLRRGMKWSDGEPFTADDVLFWREDLDLNSELSSGLVALQTAGGMVEVRKLDDHTVEFVAPVPHPLLPQMLFLGPARGFGFGGGLAPKHYLSKYLPKYTSMHEANSKAKDAGFDSWSLYVLNQVDFTLNPSLPVVTPWVVTRPINKPPWTFEANPYGVWVDTDGNQLPYMNVTMKDAGNSDVLTSRAVAGSYTFQERGLALPSLPVLLKNQERGDYKLYRAPNDDLNAKIRINLAYEKDKVLGDLLRNVNFRRALSLGIDRKEINETFLLGAGTPTAAMVGDRNKYFPGPAWRTKWATHDVKQANKLLDDMGLQRKDGQGFRLRPGDNQHIQLEFQTVTNAIADFSAISEMVKRHWHSIGIDATVSNVDSALITKNVFSNQVMLWVLDGFSDDVLLSRAEVLPVNDVGGVIGIPYAQWFDTDGKQGKRPPASLGLEKAMNIWKRAVEEVDEAKRIEMGKQIYKMHADQVWSIGMVGFAPLRGGLYTVKTRLGNVPRRYLNSQILMWPPSKAYPMTFYNR